jgi:hypothetical protein
MGAFASKARDIDSSSVGGADDSDEESESDMVGRVLVSLSCRTVSMHVLRG